MPPLTTTINYANPTTLVIQRKQKSSFICVNSGSTNVKIQRSKNIKKNSVNNKYSLMSTQTVTVLTPNGRRQTVKVAPNKTVLQILEEVCQKHHFDPNSFDLIHHRRTLDLSLMFRFTGLPNNAQLEMVDAKTTRVEQNITLCLQLEDGTRLTETFKPSAVLKDVVHTLSPTDYPNDTTVLIYMRTEIYGPDIATTTLKCLGLSSGRAIMRLVHRNPEELKMQANVSAPLPRISAVELQYQPPRIISSSDTKNIEDLPTNAIQPIRSTETIHTHSSDASESMEVDVDVNKGGYRLNRNYTKSPTPEKEIKKSKIEENREIDRLLMAYESEIKDLGIRNAVIYSLNEFHVEVDFPDSFYDLTVEDVRKILRDLRNESQDLHEAPLQTAKMRELEESKKVLNNMVNYKKTVIRIQFPERLVLQGIFLPSDTIELVKDFVRNFLKDSAMEFYLYTTPPKLILDGGQYLVEAKCVPQALLHFGSEQLTHDESDKLLKDEYYQQISTPSAASYLAMKCRGLTNTLTSSVGASSSVSGSSDQPTRNLGAIPKQYAASSDFRTSSTVPEKKLPKWFKGVGK